MNRVIKTKLWSAAVVISTALIPNANAQDLFDDAFLGEANTPAAPAQANEPEIIPPAVANEQKQMPTIGQESTPAPAIGETDVPALDLPADTAPLLDIPAPATDVAPTLDLPAPATAPSNAIPEPLGLDIPAPQDVSVPTNIPSLDFAPEAASKSMGLTTPPSDQILGKVSSDVFREMAEMERENNTLALQLKRESLRAEIDALKASNRQMLFDEIERREKMTQARLEWELAQDLKRQDAMERKQRAEIRQKQIEAALKREEERRIQKLKDEEAERKRKEEELEQQKEAERAELKKKYEAASIVRLNNLKPTLIAASRPPKIKRTPSSRVSQSLTTGGEDLLMRKNAGQALTSASAANKEDDVNAPKQDPASSLYAVAEIRGTAGSLIAKLISKKDKTTFFAKKATILPTGHTVVDIDKDYVLLQYGKIKEMVGFPSAGLINDDKPETPAPVAAPMGPAVDPALTAGTGTVSIAPPSVGRIGGGKRTRFSGVSLAK